MSYTLPKNAELRPSQLRATYPSAPFCLQNDIQQQTQFSSQLTVVSEDIKNCKAERRHLSGAGM